MTKKQIARKLQDLGFASVEITDHVMSRGHSSAIRAGIAIDVPVTHTSDKEWNQYKAVIGIQGKWVAGMIRNSQAGRLMVQAVPIVWFERQSR